METAVLDHPCTGCGVGDPDSGAEMSPQVLGERCGELGGLIAAATAELVRLIATALTSEAWVGFGIHSPEHWATLRCGVNAGHARRLVAMARKLHELPQTAAAFAAGELSEDHINEIVRADVDPRHDHDLVALSRHLTVAQLRKSLTALPPRPEPEPADDPAEPETAEPDPEPAPVRRVVWGYGDDGDWWHNAQLPADEGALIQAALAAARDAAFRAGQATVSDADALVGLARAALEWLDPDTAAGRPPGERYQMHLHLGPEHRDATWHLGAALPDAIRQMIGCDATVRPWWHLPDGSVELGRRARVVDTKLRLVIEHRDGGCVIPGCGHRRGLHIHHIVHWEHGGRTVSSNLVALCPKAHRAVHHGDITISGNPDAPGGVTICGRDGQPITATPLKPPGRPPPQAAQDLGIPEHRSVRRSGERLQTKWLDWN